MSKSGRAIKDIAVFFAEQLVTESLPELIRSFLQISSGKPAFSSVWKEELVVFGVESNNKLDIDLLQSNSFILFGVLVYPFTNIELHRVFLSNY